MMIRKKLPKQLLCTLFMVLLGTTTYGQTTFTDNAIVYTISNDNEVSVTDYTGEDKEITIPSTVVNSNTTYTVTSIGNSAFWAEFLTSVDIPNTVTSIGSSAFQTNSLTSVTIPGNVTSIGALAFQGNSITSVNVLATTPPSLTGDPNDAFSRREDITVLVPSGLVTDYENSAGWTGFKAIVDEITSVIGATFTDNGIEYTISGENEVWATDYTGNDKEITIPSTVVNSNTTYTVTSIGNSAFSAEGLTSVDIPNTVTSIRNAAFQTNQLTSVTIPGNVTSIELFAFQGNPITSVSVLATNPPSLTGDPDDAFSNREGITVLVPSGSVTAYENSASWTGFKAIVDEILSIDNKTLNETIHISPNPVTNALTINGATDFELKEATVYTITGKQLLSTTNTTINTSNLPTGLYILKIENTEGLIAIKKIVKQ
ncbi:MAG: leucine-rich repeat domain-containing protein [Aliiglaciecola sp.]|uniref:leucine-rich repeat domain-containing protein n=1 Tax=Aliiglaciecola sp. TaxID=1872441 RepID=UPI00329A4462